MPHDGRFSMHDYWPLTKTPDRDPMKRTGLISDPPGRAKSVVLTGTGLRQADAAFVNADYRYTTRTDATSISASTKGASS